MPEVHLSLVPPATLAPPRDLCSASSVLTVRGLLPGSWQDLEQSLAAKCSWVACPPTRSPSGRLGSGSSDHNLSASGNTNSTGSGDGRVVQAGAVGGARGVGSVGTRTGTSEAGPTGVAWSDGGGGTASGPGVADGAGADQDQAHHQDLDRQMQHVQQELSTKQQQVRSGEVDCDSM